MKKVLIIEDNKDLSSIINEHLVLNGYDTEQLYAGKDVLPELNSNRYDLVLLNYMLEDTDIDALVSKIGEYEIPTIILTIKNMLHKRIEGLDSGADDYLLKPFESVDLLSRIKMVLKRAEDTSSRLEFENIVVDLDRHNVLLDSKEVFLTAKEFDLLCYLIKYKLRALTRERLLSAVWGYEYAGGTRTVDIHMQKIRSKLAIGDCIKTIYKIGYRLENRALISAAQ